MKLHKYCSAVCLIIGASLILLGAVLVGVRKVVLHKILSSEFPVRPKSETYELWKDPPVPMYLSFYLFNCTNPDEVQKGGIPEVREMGPYTYREVHHIVNITWNDNATVSFMLNRTWYFDANRTVGSENDLVTALNVPLMAILNRFKNDVAFVQILLNGLLNQIKETLFVTKPVKEWIFDGYDDVLMDDLKKIEKLTNKTFSPFDRFGWFYKRNGTVWGDGNFTMFTGEDAIMKLGVADRWNGENVTHYYPAPCGIINGSAGQLFPPNRNKSSISIFITDLCRDITLNFAKEVSSDKFTLYRYEGDASMIANETENSDNKCFNPKPRPSGVFDVAACKFGAPAFVSYPHFYLADKSYLKQVKGMHPNATKHTTYIDLEPISGTATKVLAKLQINLQLQPMKYISLVSKVKSSLVPMMWFTEDVTITDDLKSMIHTLVGIPHLFMIVGYIVLAVGCVLLTLFMVDFLGRTRVSSSPEKEPLLREERRSESSYTTPGHPLHSENLLS